MTPPTWMVAPALNGVVIREMIERLAVYRLSQPRFVWSKFEKDLTHGV